MVRYFAYVVFVVAVTLNKNVSCAVQILSFRFRADRVFSCAVRKSKQSFLSGKIEFIVRA